MENILLVLGLILMGIYKAYSEAKKSEEEGRQKQQQPPEDTDYTFYEEEPESEIMQLLEEPVGAKPFPRRIERKYSEIVKEEPVQQEIVAPNEKRERIRLRNTSDAKKAFIYSEIFSRKY